MTVTFMLKILYLRAGKGSFRRLFGLFRCLFSSSFFRRGLGHRFLYRSLFSGGFLFRVAVLRLFCGLGELFQLEQPDGDFQPTEFIPENQIFFCLGIL